MLVDQVRKDMFEALKARDKEKKAILSLLVAALDKAAKDKRSELNKYEEGQVVVKLVKQVKEAIETCPENRLDILNRANRELEILSKYEPEQLDRDDIIQEIGIAMVKLGIKHPTQKDRTKIFYLVFQEVKGKADGKFVSEIINEVIDRGDLV